MQYASTLQEALTDVRAAYREQSNALQDASDRNEALALAFDDEDAARGRRTAQSTPSEPEPDTATAQVAALSLELKRTEGKLVEFQERELERPRAESTHPAQEKPPPEAHPIERPNPGEKAKEETNLPINPCEESSGGATPEREESEAEVRWTWQLAQKPRRT